MAAIFITGGTGYMGSRLIPALTGRGHKVTALARTASIGKLPPGCAAVSGEALNGESYQRHVPGADTFVHLVGVAHPSPAKAREFEGIDRKSAFEAIHVARDSGIKHFVYVSVAHPAPVMHAYIAARSACEAEIDATGVSATILRPWYVLGPGHLWPYVLKPAYRLAEWIPQTREGARRLGLVTLDQMISALVAACESPHPGVDVWQVPDIRRRAADLARR